MSVTSDDDTGYFILDKYRQNRSIKIPSTSFCWPMVDSSEKATLFENLNSFETITEINSLFYYDQAYTSTQHTEYKTETIVTRHLAIVWIFSLLAVVSAIAFIVLLCVMRARQSSIDMHNEAASKLAYESSETAIEPKKLIAEENHHEPAAVESYD